MMQFLSGLQGLGAEPPSAEQLADMVDMPRATAYNARHVGAGWTTVGAVNASTQDFATLVAMFEYAMGMRVTGALTPEVLRVLAAHQKTNVHGYADKRIYAISLAVGVVVQPKPKGSMLAIGLAALAAAGFFLLRNR
jgi:hypothetical protein